MTMTEEEQLAYEARVVGLIESIERRKDLAGLLARDTPTRELWCRIRRKAYGLLRAQRMAQAAAEFNAQDDSGGVC